MIYDSPHPYKKKVEWDHLLSNEVGCLKNKKLTVILTDFEVEINGFKPPINFDGRIDVGAVLILGTKLSNHIKFHINPIYILFLPNVSIINEAIVFRIYKEST